MTMDLVGKIRAAAVSPLLRAAASVRRDGGAELGLGRVGPRRLTLGEVEQLERAGNVADDWGRVRVVGPFDVRRVRGCSFGGDVLLGRFTGRTDLAGASLATGVYDSVLHDCVIGDDVLIRGVRLLAHHVVCPGAVLFNCGIITAGLNSRFGNGTIIRVGPQA